MKLRQFIKEIPKLPLSALVFYFIVFVLWNLNIIPPPSGIVKILENLYNQYGLIGLAISAFLEGIVYLGLYFPGSFIIALAVFFSDGRFISLFNISLVVAIILTITSLINYFLGRYIVFKNHEKIAELIKKRKFSKGLFLSMLHPNLLAFYFFNAGMEKHNPWKILFVPVIMLPYGFILAWILSSFKTFLKSKVENPYVMLVLILIWLLMAFIFEHMNKRRRMKLYQEID